MKKEQLKECIGELNLVVTEFEADGMCYMDRAVSVTQVYDLIDQLDEPEVLSQEWIDENKFEVNGWNEAVHVEDLQNLIVPKQEELETKIQELIESYKQEEDAYSNRENGWISGFIEDLKNLVEKEQKYYVINNEKYFLLVKNKAHGFVFSTGGNSRLGGLKNSSAKFELTEQEIKDYDERYWAFAKPVEELEE